MKFTKGKYEKFNIIGFTVYRILRLSPQLVIFILLTILLPKFGSGPIWNTHIGPIVENCRRNWWHNLLFMQTFLSIEPNEKQLNMVGDLDNCHKFMISMQNFNLVCTSYLVHRNRYAVLLVCNSCFTGYA